MTLSDDAYSAIKQMIVTLKLPPGAVVDESALQDQLSIGRTPIREAIQRLERDQFVSIIARRGVFVTEVDVAELATLFETRSVVEPYSARLAAERGADTSWDEMAKCLSSVRRNSTASSILGVDRRCHEIMWDAAANRFLTSTLAMLYDQSERVWYLHLRGSSSDLDSVLAEHHELLDVLRRGRAREAEKLMLGHVRAFHSEIQNEIKQRSVA